MDTSPALISRARHDAVVFDMDGVVTQTSVVHAAAWKALFDAYLKTRSAHESGDFRPFDEKTDYRLYVDGKPRYDGVRDFLAARGIELPEGQPSDPPELETVCGLGNRKNVYFNAEVKEHGITAYPSTVALIHRLREAGVRVGLMSSSKNTTMILDVAGLTDLFEVRVDGVAGRGAGPARQARPRDVPRNGAAAGGRAGEGGGRRGRPLRRRGRPPRRLRPRHRRRPPRSGRGAP